MRCIADRSQLLLAVASPPYVRGQVHPGALVQEIRPTLELRRIHRPPGLASQTADREWRLSHAGKRHLPLRLTLLGQLEAGYGAT